ncbi:PAS domain-containing protein [Aquincola sp. J276]|uniref:PAS domain-containing protein n=1 Tax=Aquincola sp. J276 TaxID=2898432 RepID=UPI002150E322|nr:PAS domain-containing protein [Aquincola sp. J276]
MSDCAMAVLDTSGCMLWQNSAFTTLIGRPPGALQGLHLAAVLHSAGSATSGAPQPLSIAHRLAAGQRIEGMELPGLHTDGRPWVGRLSVAPDPGGHYLLATLADVTEAHRLRQHNEQLREQLDVVQQLAGIGLWECDARTQDSRWDRQTFRLAGQPPGPQPPTLEQLARRIHPDDDFIGRYRRSLLAPGDYSARFRLHDREGGVRHLHSQWRVQPGADGLPRRVLGILRDATDLAELVRSFEDTSAHLSMALELGNIAIWRHDLRNDSVACNPQMRSLAALPPGDADFAHADWLAAVHPADLPRVQADLAQARRGTEPTDLQARYRGPDGSWRMLLTRRVAQRDEQGRVVALLGVAFDVSGQAADAERALALARTLEAAARATGLGICALERRGRRHRRWHITWNAQMHALSAWPAGRRPPLRLSEWVRHCVHEDDAMLVQGVISRWLRRPSGPLDLQFRTRTPPGDGPRWLSVRGDAPDDRQLFAVVMDVTDRHLSLQRLQAAVERAELATRGVGIGTWERRADGTVLWDEQMFRLREMPMQVPAPDTAARLAVVHPDDREAMACYHPSSEGMAMSPTYEFRVVLPDGRVRWLASRSRPLPDAHGREMRRIGVNWDITDNKMAELAQREREAALRESQAKSRLLARISHELRTPLNAILGVTQLMLMAAGTPDPAQRQRQLEQVQSASRHLLALIDGVLDLSAYEGGEMRLALRPVDLSAVVAQSVSLLASAAQQRGITIEGPAAGPPPPPPRGDATRLRQVLVNLLSNAIKYNRPQGSVRIATRAVAADQVPEGHEKVGHVVLSVADTGPGIRPGQIDQLFQPFNRLGREHDEVEGTGIGLAIVKALAGSMGGWVQVHSSPGEGSTFEVWLQQAQTADEAGLPPATPAPPGTPSRADDLRRPLPRLRSDGTGSVLYIEDNPINAMIVQASMAHRPLIQLQVAVDGTSGIRLAGTSCPDLVLLDMQLPDTDGHAVLKALRADPRTAHLPCIALSANVMSDDIQRALAAGFTDYWTKPIELPALLGALDTLFGRAGEPPRA